MTYTVKTEEYNARPSRGYHNNKCTITFERTPDGWVMDEAQREIAEHVRSFFSSRNMWCYGVRPKSQDVWSFEYGIDSGD